MRDEGVNLFYLQESANDARKAGQFAVAGKLKNCPVVYLKVLMERHTFTPDSPKPQARITKKVQ